MCLEAGWRSLTYPEEIGCRGYTGSSIQRVQKSLPVTGSKLKMAEHPALVQKKRPGIGKDRDSGAGGKHDGTIRGASGRNERVQLLITFLIV